MASSSTFLSSSAPLFPATKFAVNSPDFAPNRVNFRQFRVSAAASCASTVERPTISRNGSQSSLYDILGIQMGATCHEIKAAYRKLARILHPDVTANGGGDGDFIRVHEAYATLSDPEKRADYDQMLCKQRRFYPSYAMSASAASMASSAVASGFSGYTRRTWETDQCW